MQERPILIAQISDLHIKRPGVWAYGKVDTAAALARCVETLNCFSPRLDFVVISGDLVDTPAKEEYDHLLALLAPLKIPFAAIPGNHDDRALMRAALPGQPYATSVGALNLACTAGALDIVLLDSSVPGASHGELDTGTLAWLDAELATSATRPALVILHHPPFITGIDHMDVQNLRNAGDLAFVLRRHQRVRLISAGHVHRAVLATVRRYSGHNLPGAQSCCRPRPQQTISALLQNRTAGFSFACVFSERRLGRRRHSPRADWHL